MKFLIGTIIVLITLLAILYLIPVKQKNFFDLYQKEDKASKQLKEFYKKQPRYIVVDGVKWKYLITGKGDKVILFLHGMGGAYDLWWQQVAAFENNYKIITYTLPDEVDNLEDATQGIRAILDKEKVGRFIAVGTSMGGLIAQYLLKIMPEKLEKVVFGNTFTPNKLLYEQNKSTAKIVPFLPEIVISKFGEKSLKEKLLPTAHNDSLLAAFLPSLPFSKKSFINRSKIVFEFFGFNPSLYKYKRVPKLIIESDNDPLIPPELRKQIKEFYPDAEVYTFHGEGHFPYINAASKYNRVLKAFFQKPNIFEQMEKTVNTYFEGRKKADVNLLKQAFSPQARLIHASDTTQIISLEDYLNHVSTEGPQSVETRILDADHNQNTGVVKTLFVYPKKKYTDYLMLTKEKGEWRIIGKVFERN